MQKQMKTIKNKTYCLCALLPLTTIAPFGTPIQAEHCKQKKKQKWFGSTAKRVYIFEKSARSTAVEPSAIRKALKPPKYWKAKDEK